jgi:glycine betaine/proline transport system ATP-binding protein
LTETVISCRNVWKIFGPAPETHMADLIADPQNPAVGHVIAVRDVSLDVQRGEMLVVMGLSGSGKSTLVRCLSRLIEITGGAVTIEGREIGTLTEPELIDLRRRKMGMVFQSFGLLPHRTVLDNVAFPLEMRGQDRATRYDSARAMLDLVGLKGREAYFPRELSGGQQQRVGIARSLVVEPDIWFLDEPFSALDPLIRREMQDEFLRLKGIMNKTIIFITHDFDEALRLADRIAIMKDGRIEQCDTPDQIVLHPATDYVAKFTADIDRARVVHAGGLAGPLSAPAQGAPVSYNQSIRELARLLVNDTRTTIPVAGANGQILGGMDRQEALNILLGDAA